MGSAQDKLILKLAAQRVWVPPHFRMVDGQIIKIGGYWRGSSGRGGLESLMQPGADRAASRDALDGIRPAAVKTPGALKVGDVIREPDALDSYDERTGEPGTVISVEPIDGWQMDNELVPSDPETFDRYYRNYNDGDILAVTAEYGDGKEFTSYVPADHEVQTYDRLVDLADKAKGWETTLNSPEGWKSYGDVDASIRKQIFAGDDKRYWVELNSVAGRKRRVAELPTLAEARRWADENAAEMLQESPRAVDYRYVRNVRARP